MVHKNLRWGGVLPLLLIMAFAVIACGSDDDNSPKKSGAISYAKATIEKTLGNDAFINPLTNTGDGAVTYTSSDTKVATVEAKSGLVTIAGIGSTTITATVKDSSEYTYATKTASYTLTVKEAVPEKKAGNIAFATTEIEKTIGDSTFTNPLTKEGDGVVTYTSSDIKVAIVDGATGTVVLTGNAGSTTITATVADSATYAYSTKTASFTLTVKKLAGTISFARSTLEISVNETSFTNALTKTGDGTVTYTSSDTNVATVHAESGEVTIKGLAGNTTITATVADSDKYTYSTKTATYMLTVSQTALERKKGSITYAAVELEKAIDEAAFTNPLTMTGDGTVTYTSTNTNVATVDAATGVVTMIAEGETIITATVADSAEYTYATKKAFYTLKVTKSASGKKTGSISWTTGSVGKTTLDPKFTNALEKTGDGQVVFTSSDTTIATVDVRNGEVTLKGVAGTTTITATVEDSNEYYYSIKTLSYVLTVSKAAGTIGYGINSVEKTVDDTAFTNSLTKTGDGTVTYSSSNTNVATVDASSGLVTPVAEGSAVITATVEDGTKYTYATKTASYTVTVKKHTGSIKFSSSSVTKTTSTNYFSNDLKHTGDSTVTYASSNTEVAVVNASTGTVSIKGTGTATITATVTDTAKYTYSEKTASFTLTVNQASEGGEYQISFSQYNWDKSTLDAPFVPDFNNNGDGIVEFTSNNPSSATVDPVTGEVTILGGEGALITARIKEERSAHYDAGKQWATCYIHLTKENASISYSQTTINKTTEDGKFTNPLTNTGDGTASYSSSNTDVATIDANTGEVTIKGNTGSTTITANIADGPKYKYPNVTKMNEDGTNSTVSVPMTATYTLAVRRASSISYSVTAIEKVSNAPSFTNPLTNTGDGTVKYSSSNTAVAQVNSTGAVTITGGGDTTITATVSDSVNSTYSTKTVSYSLHVAQADAPVKAKPDAVGDIVLNDGTAIAAGNVLSDAQRAKAVAVIFYKPDGTDPNATKMLGFGLYESAASEKREWCKGEAQGFEKNINDLCYDYHNSYPEYPLFTCGAGAWNILAASVTDEKTPGLYPAWEWVNSYGTATEHNLTGTYADGWYLPSVYEITKMKIGDNDYSTVLATVNRSLTNAGAKTISGRYWTCNTVYRDHTPTDCQARIFAIENNEITYWYVLGRYDLSTGVRAIRAFE